MERIWVGYRPAVTLFGDTYYHKILYYENKSGVVRAIEAVPQYPTANDNLLVKSSKLLASEILREPVLGHLKVFEREYRQLPEYDNGPWEGGGWERELISEGSDLSGTWNMMKEDAASINAKYEYRPLLQNSNSTADEIIRRNGLMQPTEQVGENQFPTPGNDRPLRYPVIRNPLTGPAGPGLSDGPVHEYPLPLDKHDNSENQLPIDTRPNGFNILDNGIANSNAQPSLDNVLSVGLSPAAERIWARLLSGPRRRTDFDEEWHIQPQWPQATN